VPPADEARSAMTAEPFWPGDELASDVVTEVRTTRAWPAAVTAAAAVTAIVAALVLIPALAGDRKAPSPAPLLPPVSIAALPPGVVPWVTWPAPPVKDLQAVHVTGLRSRLDVLKATLAFPGRITLGIAASYTVTLANPTRERISLSPCPSYSQALAGAATPVTYYYLNCGAVHSIPARGAVTFEMMAPAPGQPGKVSMVWRLQGTDVDAGARAVVLTGTPGGLVS
jgi:hypothetical protein